MTMNQENSSFRDPCGFVFYKGGKIFRQVNAFYKDDYDLLFNSGLYKSLTSKKLLVIHKEVKVTPFKKEISYKIIEPQNIPFISYPYEWCFSQLKDAALTMLKIQKLALEHGMTLKDASAYNIQFLEGKPILIDTLSFEKFSGQPWQGYKQFCQHFLAPLALSAYKDIRLQQLSRIYIDGIPLDLANSMLPRRTYFNLSILLNIHLHSKNLNKTSPANSTNSDNKTKISKHNQLGLIDNLSSFIEKLQWKFASKETEWGDYYSFTNYSDDSFKHKKNIIEKLISKKQPQSVLDLGANNGEFSRIASQKGIFTISCDIDPIAVEKNYLKSKKTNDKNILPLILDLTNPSPALGWENQERRSFGQRSSVDVILALALIHHLAISNNLPFEKIAAFLASLGKSLIIEFVPKEDSKVKILLSTRKDIFKDYSENHFEKAFSNYFKITEKIRVAGSKRTIYLMDKK